MTKHGTKIEWTHIPGYKGESWNPIVGCDIVSKGCTNCYAMRFANQRLDGNEKSPQYKGTTKRVNGKPVWTGLINKASEKKLLEPLRWKKPRSIFVNSMGDVFHENVPDEWIDEIFAVMALCPQHIFILLTKRPERMREWVLSYRDKSVVEGLQLGNSPPITFETVFSHLWLGTSVEDQATANERIPHLLDTPAAVRFLSCEPLLGEIDLENVIYPKFAELHQQDDYFPKISYDTLRGHMKGPDDIGLDKLDWIIAGGESGPGARPMHPDWARQLRDQCQDASVPFFFKQWGHWRPIPDEYKCQNWMLIDADGSVDIPDCRWPDESIGEYRAIDCGKKAAGHLLDGTAHRNWPECVELERELV